jgi:hypothetical protein
LIPSASGGKNIQTGPKLRPLVGDSGWSFASNPIHRSPLQIHHGKNADMIRFDGIQKSIRKTSEESSAYIPHYELTCLRILKDGLGTKLDLIKERHSKSWAF